VGFQEIYRLGRLWTGEELVKFLKWSTFGILWKS